jgi:hypothetical protein
MDGARVVTRSSSSLSGAFSFLKAPSPPPHLSSSALASEAGAGDSVAGGENASALHPRATASPGVIAMLQVLLGLRFVRLCRCLTVFSGVR